MEPFIREGMMQALVTIEIYELVSSLVVKGHKDNTTYANFYNTSEGAYDALNKMMHKTGWGIEDELTRSAFEDFYDEQWMDKESPI
jgi:hypothetical protein